MQGFNVSSDLGGIINVIGEFILGDLSLVGIWLIIIFIGLGVSLRIDFTLILVFLIPLTIVLLAFNLIIPVFGGLIILFDAFILGSNFIFKR